MKCTACNSVVKPVVAIDIDGTLGDFHRHQLEFACAYWDRSQLDTFYAERYDGSERFREYMSRTFGVSVEEFRAMKLAYRQGGMKRTMPCFLDSHDLTRSLRQAGAEVWLTTTRPYNRLDSVDPDTREWLRRNDIEFDHLLYGDDKYEKLAEYVGPERVVAVLDDEWDQVMTAVGLFGPAVPVLRLNGWNAAHSGKNAVTNLAEFRHWAEVAIATWKEERS